MTSLVDWGDRGTCVLFGDGAGAAVLGAASEGGIVARRWGADGTKGHLIYYGPKPDDADSPDRLRMAGNGTFRMAVETFCDVTAGVCADAGWDPASIGPLRPAPGQSAHHRGRRKTDGHSDGASGGQHHGNRQHQLRLDPLALAGAAAQRRFKRGDRVVVAAFGAGATWGAVALEWNAD